MTSLRSIIFQHTLPETFKKHPNSPWKPIKGLTDLPYILTIDSFEAANKLWRLDEELGLRLLVELDPPPRSSSQIWWIICSPAHNLLLVAYPYAARDYSSNGLLCKYAMDTGRKLGNDTTLPEGFGDVDPLRSGDYLAVTSTKRHEQSSYLIYKLSEDGLQEIRQIRDTGGPTIGGNISAPLCLFRAGSDALLTAIAKIPCNTITLTSYDWSPGSDGSRGLVLPAHFEDSDLLTPIVTLPLPASSSIALVIEESASAIDYHPHYRQGTVCLIDMSEFSLKWRTVIPHSISKLTHHASLGMFVVLGTQYQPQPYYIITFLDEQTGKVYQERKYVPERDRGLLTAGCTSDDYFVLIYQTGRTLRVPLERLMNEGFPVDEENNIVMQDVPDRPEPYNTKARKMGDKWKWIEKIILTEKGLVLFPARGPGVYFVEW